MKPSLVLAHSVRSLEAKRKADEIVELYLAGKSATEIATEGGHSQTHVRRILRERGQMRPVRRMNSEEIDKAKLMLADGQTYYAVGQVLGYDGSTIKRNVPGFHVLTPKEASERATLGRQMRKLTRGV